MGYRVSAEGTIMLKKGTPEDIIRRVNMVFADICEEKKLAGITELQLWHNDSFDSQTAMEMLEETIPYTTEGEINVEGEDGNRWRYRFVEEYSKWVHEDCFPVFEEYSEDEKGNAAYAVPVYALVFDSMESAKDAMNIQVFSSEEKADEECRRKNSGLETECSGSRVPGCYKVVKTCLQM